MMTVTSLLALLTGTILPFIIILTVIVFIHEGGHYLAGRWCGIGVTTFSIGFGPELFGFNDKHGTRWKLSALPLGGYVKFLGDGDAASMRDDADLSSLPEEERARTFAGAGLWKKAVTVAAGPIANFLLAILIFTAVFAIYGRTVADPVVAEVKAGSAAEAAGIKPGDVLLSFDSVEVKTFEDVQRYVFFRPDIPMVVTVKRDADVLKLPITPHRQTITDPASGNKTEIGVIGVTTTEQTGHFRTQTYSLPEALGQGVIETTSIIGDTFHYIGSIFTGHMKADQLGGPIRVAQASGMMASLGLVMALRFTAYLSVSIGLFNLFPVPILDGGHLVFYALEGLRGKPLGARAQEIAFFVGLVMVLSLMVFATWNDIAPRFGL